MSDGRLHEHTFNVALGEALCQTNPRWSDKPARILVEQVGILKTRDARPVRADILLHDEQLPPVVIECSYIPSDAEKDAKARLGCTYSIHNIRTAVALHVPAEFKRMYRSKECTDQLLDGRPIFSSIFQLLKRPDPTSLPDLFERRWPDTGFVKGSVHDLSALISGTALPKEDIERVATRVADLVRAAAAYLTILTSDQLSSLAAHVHQRSPLKALRTIMVLWLNALLTQQRLHQSGVIKRAVPVTSSSPIRPSEQIAIWRRIHTINWRSVFEPAVDALERLGRAHPHATSKALRTLVKAVETIEVAQLGLHINVGAELFPKLSEDRKQAAAFYTQPSTAELLATLTILPSDLTPEQWGREDLFRDFRLADLACGTGTLLRAGFRRIASLHQQHGGTLDSLRSLHRTAMEHGLIGTDISPIAAHLTTSSLAALGQGEPYGDTQIGWVDVGGYGKGARTGSLEYFAAPMVADLFTRSSGISSGIAESQRESVEVEDGSMDWILMNPPYSRTRGGQSVFDVAGLLEEERKACQDRWGILVKDQPVIRTAGLAASFLALARQKCKPGGRIGFVLPLSAAFAKAWDKTRQMLEHDFEDITAITVAAGQALGRDALSADTNMEEMLLVASKREGLSTPPPENAFKKRRGG